MGAYISPSGPQGVPPGDFCLIKADSRWVKAGGLEDPGCRLGNRVGEKNAAAGRFTQRLRWVLD